MYALYDSKLEAYQQPFFSPNDQTALRMVKSALTDGGQMFCRHPGDFSLWVIGSFTDDTGMLQPRVPEILVQMTVLVETQEENKPDLQLMPPNTMKGTQ